MVLTEMWGPQRDEVIVDCGKLYIEERHASYPSPNINRAMK
jgi:hypothetical protein